MKFYNRTTELTELERVWKLSKNSMHFTMISGRRRVGKTELVKQFCKNKKNFYFFIGRKNPQLLLEELSRILKEKIPGTPTFTKFDEFLEYLYTHLDRTVIFFDEFQNLNYVDKSSFSEFQKEFDKYKTKANLHIVVAGSQSTMMDKIFSDSKEPLFGRATERYSLKPLNFKTVCDILKDMKITSKKDAVEWYSVFGGIPKYYVIAEEQGISNMNVLEALQLLMFREFSPLGEEAKTVLIEEFGKEHSTYFSILEAVSTGNSEMTTIANRSGINIKSVSKYLSSLVNTYRYLKYEVPVTEKKPWRSKKGRYFIRDPIFRFWFRYIYRNRSEYERGNYKELLDFIKKDFNCYLGRMFEDILTEALSEILPDKLQFSNIGRWWHKDKEIDIVALNEEKKEIAFFECKWKELTETQARSVLKDLMEKSGHVNWNDDKRSEYFGLFAKKIENKPKLRREGFLVYDLGEF